MGDTRIDGTTPRTTDYDDCDEKTLVCGGGTPKEKLVSSEAEEWHAPELPPQKPAEIATVAKNMSTAPPVEGAPDDSEAWRDHTFHHAGTAADKSPGVEAEAAFRKNDDYSLFDVSAKASLGHTGIQGSVGHAHLTHDFGPVDVAVNGDVGSAGFDEGSHNADESWGVHAGGGAVAYGVDATAHLKGVGSVTVGASAGVAVEASIGLKHDGKGPELCGRIGLTVFTFGACIPLHRM